MPGHVDREGQAHIAETDDADAQGIEGWKACHGVSRLGSMLGGREERAQAVTSGRAVFTTSGDARPAPMQAQAEARARADAVRARARQILEPKRGAP